MGQARSLLRSGKGKPSPQGCSEGEGGKVNFVLNAPKSSSAWLLFTLPPGHEAWEKVGASETLCELFLRLDPSKNKTGNMWHIEVALGDFAAKGVRYAWILTPALDENGQPSKTAERIIDPYARELDTPHAAAWNVRNATRYSPMAVVPDLRALKDFDWQGVESPGHALKDLVIYEAHVRGFTRNPDSGLQSWDDQAGTFLAFVEKIPHLLKLGINCVEFLPIFEFDETACPRKNPHTGEMLCNYWGYSTVAFFVPMQRFASRDRTSGAIIGMKTLVRELHRVGIEVMLDVVFNHTAEGTWGENNWHSWRSIAKENYYLLSKGCDTNYTGCGNTMNANDDICAEWIVECVKYWALEIKVDGFRFDLASTLCRGRDGQICREPNVIKRMSNDPDLKHVKLVAEPWDCSWPDGYLVGKFPSCGAPRWSEWNGKFRDAVRSFLKGDEGMKGEFATRITGSSDLFKHNGRSPCHSINFITAHDGFTLRDLVSYNGKQNSCNGENSGDDHNNSWNCGAEGPTGDGGVNCLRERQMRNFLVTLLLGVGTPMLVFGDEYGRSQRGCNNGWCQDALSWFSWTDCDKEQNKLLRFTSLMIAMRKRYQHIFCRDTFMTDKDIWWRVLWDDPYNYMCYVLHDNQATNGYSGLLFAFNSGHEHRECDLPAGKQWFRLIDTNLPSPKDVCENEQEATQITSSTYGMQPYSCLVLKCMTDKREGFAYTDSEMAYAQQQQTQEHLREVVRRRASMELLPNFEPEQVRTNAIMKRMCSMSGIVLAMEEDEDAFIERAPSSTLMPVTISSCLLPGLQEESKPILDNGVKKGYPEKLESNGSQPGKNGNSNVNVRFSVTCEETQPGEAVFVAGSAAGVGSWNLSNAVKCTTNAATFPVWVSDQVSLPAGSKLEFKLVVGSESNRNSCRWEGGDNRVSQLPGSKEGQVVTLSCSWQSKQVSQVTR